MTLTGRIRIKINPHIFCAKFKAQGVDNVYAIINKMKIDNIWFLTRLK